MDLEDPRLLELVVTILDDPSVDWEKIEASAADSGERRLILWLRSVRRIAEVHRKDHSIEKDPSHGAMLDASEGSPRREPGLNTPEGPIPEVKLSHEDSTVIARAASRATNQIGGFRIIRKLGEGGMGVVYEAEQQNPKRPVALKVIRGGGHVDDNHVRMFRREVQTLARLKHPGIAAIYESGHTEDGQHFFAMELVRGETLGEYCKRRAPEGALSPVEVKERLALFRKICDAVNYAHQRGVIHRDLKPANILVQRDARMAPATGSSSLAAVSDIKILDFGLARITDSDVAVSTVLTDLGSVQGTIPYMSPEQVRGNPDEIDLRTDVYSLGVVLYEMLAGQLPLDVQRVQLPEAVRIICEESPKPLVKTWRGTRRLDADLQTIVHKAIEKEPARRYQSAAALAEDLQRYVTDQPILARPPSAAYQLRKLVARHKAPVAFVVALFAVLAAFAVVMTTQAGRIARERDRANREAESAKQVSEFLVSLFKVSDPSEARGNTITAREILDRASARIAHELQDQPLVQARMMSTIGKVDGGLGLVKEAVPLLEEALRIREKILGTNHPDVAQSLYDLAFSRDTEQAASDEDALALLRRSLEIREKVLGPDHPDVAYSLWAIGTTLIFQGDYRAARPLLERAQAIFEKKLGPDDIGVAWCLTDIAQGLIWVGDCASARPRFERALKIKEKILEPDSPDVAVGLADVGWVLTLLGDYGTARPYLERSLAICEKVLPSDHGMTAEVLTYLSECLHLMHEDLKAKPLLERASAIQEKEMLSPRDLARTFGRTQNCLALVLTDLGEITRAEECFKHALAMREKVLGPNDLDVALSLEGYAVLLRKTGRAAEAASLEARAQAIRAALRNVEEPGTTRKGPDLESGGSHARGAK
jgi:serine/threonine protein kinase